jgi:hypothetical protein
MGKRAIGYLSLLICLFPLMVFAARPYAGLEYGLFMPQGEWSEKMGMTPSFRMTVHQTIYGVVGAALTAGYVSFKSDEAKNCEFSMRPFIYVDVLGEKTLRENPQVAAAMFAGMTYSNQRVTFEEGDESSSVKGYSLGGMVSTRFMFAKKIYVKLRFIVQEATDGRELCFGINF